MSWESLIQTGGTTRTTRHETGVRLRRGVYAPTEIWNNLPAWEQHRLRILAFRIAHPLDVLSHVSAAIAHELPTFVIPMLVQVFDADRASTAKTGGTIRHTSADPRGVVDTHLGPATSLVDTAIDIARTHHPAHALALWDEVLRRGIALDDLVSRAASQVSTRGTRTIAWLREHATPLAESPGESVSRALIEWLGFPSPELQATVHTPDGSFRGDCLWREYNVLGEFDGYEKYGLGAGTAMQELRREKRREDALRRTGLKIARWEYRDVTAPNRLEAILKDAGLPQTRHSSPAQLRAFRLAHQRV